MNSIFITGTNTDIGKTFISAMMLSSAITHQLPINYFKPIQTGNSSDCDDVQLLTQCEDQRIIKPVYTYPLPATPYLAAREENETIDHQKILQRFQEISCAPNIVEGAGGLLAPVCEKTTMRDVIKTLDLPMLVVAGTVLGTMNHTLLTIESAMNAGIKIKGIILSGEPYPNLIEVLHLFSPVRVIAVVPKLEKKDFKEQAAVIFHKDLLLEIFS